MCMSECECMNDVKSSIFKYLALLFNEKYNTVQLLYSITNIHYSD